jgi:hypothetical protein
VIRSDTTGCALAAFWAADDAARDIGCDATGRSVRSVDVAPVDARGEITNEMLDAGKRAWQEAKTVRLSDLLCVMYRAMRAARPLSEGPA